MPVVRTPFREGHAQVDQVEDAAAAHRGLGPVQALQVLVVGLQFLTRLPVPAVPMVEGDLRRATAVFPLVGALVGGIALGAWALVEPLLGALPAAIAAVAVAVAVTGAFHEDGLADTYDGLWGGWDPTARVEIMRDSRIGTYGACALLLGLAARIGLLAGLTLPGAARALLVGHTVSRAVILVQIRWLAPISDRGSGAQVADPLGLLGSSVAAGTTLLVCVVALGWWTPAVLAAALLVTAALRRAARRRIGGLTGDVLGATQQLALLAVLATVVAIDRADGW